MRDLDLGRGDGPGPRLRKRITLELGNVKAFAEAFVGVAISSVYANSFDIFSLDTSIGMLWIEAVADLDIAKARVAELMQAKPCEYLIFPQTTGDKISIQPTGNRQR
jgi:hypothetical protein